MVYVSKEFIFPLIFLALLCCLILVERKIKRKYDHILTTGIAGYGRVIAIERKWLYAGGNLLFFPVRHKVRVEFLIENKRYEMEALGLFNMRFAKDPVRLQEVVPIIYSGKYPQDVVITIGTTLVKHHYWDEKLYFLWNWLLFVILVGLLFRFL